MFFSKNVTLTHGKDEASAEQFEIKCSAGVIHQVDIIFPDNSDKNIKVRLFDENYQLLPTNRDAWLIGDNTIISTREYYSLTEDKNAITIKAYNDHAADDLLLTVNIGVLPQRILTPMSFEELLAAAIGVGQAGE